MAHRKTHSPNGGYHRRSADNLLESSMNSNGRTVKLFCLCKSSSLYFFLYFD